MKIDNLTYTGLAIYCITNDSNDKLYIGQTTNYRRRAKFHLNSFRKKSHCNSYLQKVYDNPKYSLTMSIVEIPGTKYELNEREIFWIAFLNLINPLKGYNLAIGGSNIYRPPYTEEMRTQTSIMMKKRWEDGVYKPVIHSQEVRERMSKTRLEKYKNEMMKGETVTVTSLSEGKIIGTYKSIKEAAKLNGIHYRTVYLTMNRKDFAIFPKKGFRIDRTGDSKYIDRQWSADIITKQRISQKQYYINKQFEKAEPVIVKNSKTLDVIGEYNSIKSAALSIGSNYAYLLGIIKKGNGVCTISRKKLIVEKINR